MFKFLVLCGALLALANVGVFGGLIAASAPAAITLKPTALTIAPVPIALKPAALAIAPAPIVAAPILKAAPLTIASAPAATWTIASAPAAPWAIAKPATIELAAAPLGLKLG